VTITDILISYGHLNQTQSRNSLTLGLLLIESIHLM